MGKKANVYRVYYFPPRLVKIGFATQLSIGPVTVETEPSFLFFIVHLVQRLVISRHRAHNC